MQTRDELLKAIRGLPNATKLFSEPFKGAWLGWVSEYDGPGYYGRKNHERSARFIYNQLNSANQLIWLAEASGIDAALLQSAMRARRDLPAAKQAAAVRAVIPWQLVEPLLDQIAATSKQQRHFIAYHNTDTRGPYALKRSHGTFLTRKNFRAETLRGQHLWVLEGSGAPKVYRLAAHGTIANVSRDVDGEATVRFKTEGPQAPAVVNALPWFRALLTQQRSFANGFSALNDAAAIIGLEEIAIQYGEAPSTGNFATTITQALIDARLGQGRFRAALEREWDGSCSVTGCALPQVLRASHIKPWEVSTDEERMDSDNGLLLSAHIDALFDKGLISFADDGKMLVSAQVGVRDKKYFRLPRSLRVKPGKQRRTFLNYHRSHVFKA